MAIPDENNSGTKITKKDSSKIIRIVLIILVLAIAVYAAKTFLAARAMKKAATQAPATPVVAVASAEEADLAAKREYVGKVAAIQSVQLKTQVSGEIMKVHFKEGSFVRAGQLLLSIDSRQYSATAALRRAELEQAKAALVRAEKYYKRVKATDKRTISASDADTAESNFLQAKAGVAQAQAALRLAQIDLAHTSITSPITGQIGAVTFTKGNYVTPSSGALATIVQMDPIRVAFPLPDRDYLDQLKVFKEKGSVYKTDLILSNGTVYSTSGERDFEDNEVGGTTGTILMRVRFKNPEGMLVPGSMVRISTKPVKDKRGIVIPQTALMGDTKGDYVYVVGSDNTAQQRRIVLGDEYGSMREITKGLKSGEKVVTIGLQSLRPGIKVQISKMGETSKTPSELAAETTTELSTDALTSKDKQKDGGKTTSPDSAAATAKPTKEAK